MCVMRSGEKLARLFVYGGEIADGAWTNSGEGYDPHKSRTHGWTMGAPAHFGRYGASCCVWSAPFLTTQSILVVGGQTEHEEGSKHCELYDAARDSWTTLKDLNFDHG